MKSSSVPAYSLNSPAILAGIDFSDHLNFWNLGFNAVMITDTSFMRSNNYHTENDTPETLNYTKMAEVVNGVFYFLKNN